MKKTSSEAHSKQWFICHYLSIQLNTIILFGIVLKDSTLGFNQGKQPSKRLILKVHNALQETDKGDQPTDHSYYLQRQRDECRATLDHIMNTMHWSGFGSFPLQICRVKSILPEKGSGCVCTCVCLY